MDDKEENKILREALWGMLDSNECKCDEVYESGNQRFCWWCRVHDYLYKGKDWNLNRQKEESKNG